MHIFFQSTYVNIKMDKVTSIHDRSINHQVGNLDNQGIIDCWETYNFRFIKKYLVIEINVYNIALILSIMTLMI